MKGGWSGGGGKEFMGDIFGSLIDFDNMSFCEKDY